MFDIIIKITNIVDGSGKKGFAAAIGIYNDRIVKIGKIEESGKKRK